MRSFTLRIHHPGGTPDNCWPFLSWTSHYVIPVYPKIILTKRKITKNKLLRGRDKIDQINFAERGYIWRKCQNKSFGTTETRTNTMNDGERKDGGRLCYFLFCFFLFQFCYFLCLEIIGKFNVKKKKIIDNVSHLKLSELWLCLKHKEGYCLPKWSLAGTTNHARYGAAKTIFCDSWNEHTTKVLEILATSWDTTTWKLPNGCFPIVETKIIISHITKKVKKIFSLMSWKMETEASI